MYTYENRTVCRNIIRFRILENIPHIHNINAPNCIVSIALVYNIVFQYICAYDMIWYGMVRDEVSSLHIISIFILLILRYAGLQQIYYRLAGIHSVHCVQYNIIDLLPVTLCMVIHCFGVTVKNNSIILYLFKNM